MNEILREYERIKAEFESKQAEGVFDDDLYEEMLELQREMSYRAEADRF